MAKTKGENLPMVNENLPAIRSMSSLLAEYGYQSGLKTTEEVVGELVKVTGIQIRDGEFGEYLMIQGFNANTGEEVKISCGGEVVMEKMMFAAKMQAFPLLCKFTKPGRWYDVE